MSNENEQSSKKLTLSNTLTGKGKLDLKRAPESASVRQSFSHGRSKTVTVEVKRKKPGAADAQAATPGNLAGAATIAGATAPSATPLPGHQTLPSASGTALGAGQIHAVNSQSGQSASDVGAAKSSAPTEQPPLSPERDVDAAVHITGRVTSAEPSHIAPKKADSSNPSKSEPATGQKKSDATAKTQHRDSAPSTTSSAHSRSTNYSGRGGRGRDGGGRGDAGGGKSSSRKSNTLRELTDEEKASRVRALQGAQQFEVEQQQKLAEQSRLHTELAEKRRLADAELRRMEAERQAAEPAHKVPEPRHDGARSGVKTSGKSGVPANAADEDASAARASHAATLHPAAFVEDDEEETATKNKKPGKLVEVKRPTPTAKRGEPRRRSGKITVTQALDDEESAERVRSLASVRRAREREKQRMQSQSQEKIYRDVIIPDSITVQDLAGRMAERGADVIKTLMRMGVMATINQSLDADTAELIVTEFGHTPKRASESDVEIGLRGAEDRDEDRMPRPPVVTVMGHVDHGKTSLLDALRATDVAAHEAGGITQHIGAYQVTLPSKARITFIDTPGHEAFTEMRARGAMVTDIVVLVVAADDGIMPQTIEAIAHAKAAKVPIVVAVNKIDKPDADPTKVRNALLQHELVVEELGGDVLAIDVSAKSRIGLDKLEEAILLQAELLDLRANSDRTAEGTVIEAKLDRGRGPVATVLVQRGTLRVGDVFVAGGEWGRVRALIDDHGLAVKEAGPSVPVEILGLQGTPRAGDELSVVDSEARAREIADFRTRRRRDANIASAARGTVEQMLSKIAAGEAKEFPVIIKADVQGSLEALLASLARLSTGEVATRVLRAGVGGINESDVSLARASGGLIIAFNVRANVQAREMAKRDAVDIRYYSIIYNVVDDVRAALSGMLAPTLRENFLGLAEIRQIFDITRVGKVAGCYVTDGLVKRGAKVRLLRDNVVIHEGTLKTLRRIKDEVREVKQGLECGMAFENYHDIKEGDQIECFEIVEEARQL
ncbi:MAG: translation initiation factor IF-2 [Alphaproteobacteria bacterium]|nr:translation initiation factor IF-2 [Alphaproteobacteria bacterium]